MRYKCIDTRECFEKLSNKSCLALSITYEHDGECPFCKPDARITDGKYYPIETEKSTKKPR